jgi:surfactin synthase thioesterase subunit
MNRKNNWFPFESKINYSKGKNVFCFPHAGGTASTFRKWTLEDSQVNFICIELPGKGTRRNEEFIDEFELLVDPLINSILEKVKNEEFYFFGHSMGAAIAFYTACKMEKDYGRKPKKLIVAGRQAPNEDNLIEFKTYMDDTALVEELKRYKATPTEILENEEVLKFIIPELRRDYKLNESFAYSNEKLDIPILAHCGKKDYEADAGIMERWSNMTEGEFNIREFDSDHFFIFELGDTYRNQLINDILL